jgi:hypothetical protein
LERFHFHHASRYFAFIKYFLVRKQPVQSIRQALSSRTGVNVSRTVAPQIPQYERHKPFILLKTNPTLCKSYTFLFISARPSPAAQSRWHRVAVAAQHCLHCFHSLSLRCWVLVLPLQSTYKTNATIALASSSGQNEGDMQCRAQCRQRSVTMRCNCKRHPVISKLGSFKIVSITIVDT